MREAVRAALFDILGDSVTEARFLDLFAGTGSIGLRGALSRGARASVFVDSSEASLPDHPGESQRILRSAHEARASISLMRSKPSRSFTARGSGSIWSSSARPMGKELAHKTLAHMAAHPILSTAGALVVTEIFKKEKVQSRVRAVEGLRRAHLRG
jgi:hypothetical protein